MKLGKTYEEADDVVFFAIAGNDTNETVAEFRKKYGYGANWLMGPSDPIVQKYSVEGFPTTIVLDKRGTERVRQVGAPSDPAGFFAESIEKYRKGK